MALRGLLRLGELRIRVLDMALARKHYVERMGLHEVMEDADGLAFSRAEVGAIFYRLLRKPPTID